VVKRDCPGRRRKILSGVMAHLETGVQVTTGSPAALLIERAGMAQSFKSDCH